jgi:hypothetical protein
MAVARAQVENVHIQRKPIKKIVARGIIIIIIIIGEKPTDYGELPACEKARFVLGEWIAPRECESPSLLRALGRGAWHRYTLLLPWMATSRLSCFSGLERLFLSNVYTPAGRALSWCYQSN